MENTTLSLQQIMEVVTEKEFYSFAVDYAKGHPEMVEALVKRYKSKFSVEEKIDWMKEVAACYKYLPVRGNRYRHWDPDQTDWSYVRSHLPKLIRRATMWAQGNHPREAIKVALLILEETAERYTEEFIFDDYDFDYDDFCLDETGAMLRLALENETITKEDKLRVADSLEEIQKYEAFGYDIEDWVADLIKEIRQAYLSDDELLAILWRQADECSSTYDREWKLREIWDFLMNRNRQDEAIAVFRKYPDCDDLRERYGLLLEQQNLLSDALKLYKEKSKGRWEGVKWSKHCLRIYKLQNDTAHIVSTLKNLFFEDYNEYDYYVQLKSLIPVAQWVDVRDALIRKRYRQDELTDNLGKILIAEGLQTQLFERIKCQNYNLLRITQEYKEHLTPDQRDVLVDRLRQQYSRPFESLPRKEYKEKAYELNQIAQLSAKGKTVAREIVNLYRDQYRNRPALLEELQKVEV